MNNIESGKRMMEVEESYNKEDKFLKTLAENEIAFLKYKDAAEQEREKMNEQIAKTLGIPPRRNER